MNETQQLHESCMIMIRNVELISVQLNVEHETRTIFQQTYDVIHDIDKRIRKLQYSNYEQWYRRFKAKNYFEKTEFFKNKICELLAKCSKYELSMGEKTKRLKGISHARSTILC